MFKIGQSAGNCKITTLLNIDFIYINMKHSKQKGNLGFSATLKEIHKLGYNVFSEIGDFSKIDMIIELNNKLIKIQVKYATEKNGTVILHLRKCGPNGYRYRYTADDVDIFSVYLPNEDKIIFVPAKIACINKNLFKIRYRESEKKQKLKIHCIHEFENLDKILRDFTLDICNDDDKVQTTTEMVNEN
jgi:PD-(D/E)XK endonuclease